MSSVCLAYKLIRYIGVHPEGKALRLVLVHHGLNLQYKPELQKSQHRLNVIVFGHTPVWVRVSLSSESKHPNIQTSKHPTKPLIVENVLF